MCSRVAERVTGAAMRQPERRLRSWAKHERLSVAMALAEKLHHSAYRPVLPKEEEVEHVQHQRLTGPEVSRGSWEPASTSA